MPDVRTSIQISAAADAVVRAEQRRLQTEEGTRLGYGRTIERLVLLGHQAIARARDSKIVDTRDARNDTEAA